MKIIFTYEEVEEILENYCLEHFDTYNTLNSAEAHVVYSQMGDGPVFSVTIEKKE